MTFTLLDWSAILGYLAITLLLGLYFRRSAGQSAEDYFVSGRTVSWWLAGTSMVATTFAADTPLLVAGLVYTQGVAGNWIWWAFLPSGMMTVFLFARLWRRSGLMTDVQFAEIRYSGKPAAFLRGFRAVYLGLLMNCLILGWVTKAMINIVSTTLGPTTAGWPLLVTFTNALSHVFGSTFIGADGQALVVCIFFLIPFTGLYVSLGGLSGVLWTDLFQFVLKMGIVIGIAYYAVKAAGGMSTMISTIDGMRATNGGSDPMAFLPDFSRGFTSETLWTLPVITFCVYLGVQWWAFWYPGAEPGGGGYIAQRIFSARDERNGLSPFSGSTSPTTRCAPGPGFSPLSPPSSYIRPHSSRNQLHDDRQRPRAARVARHHRRRISRGLHVHHRHATQLGHLLLVEDFYRRFLVRHAIRKPLRPHLAARHHSARDPTGYVSAQLASIRSGWQVVLQVGAGTGSVYMLRWYWWRINAWSEISAMITALILTIALHSIRLDVATRPPQSLHRFRHGAVRKEHPLHYAANHGGLGDCYGAHPSGARRRSRVVLSQGTAGRDRLETRRREYAGNFADTRSCAQPVVLGSWLRHGLLRAVRRRQNTAASLWNWHCARNYLRAVRLVPRKGIEPPDGIRFRVARAKRSFVASTKKFNHAESNRTSFSASISAARKWKPA